MRKSLRNLLFSFIMMIVIFLHLVVINISPTIRVAEISITAQKKFLNLLLNNGKQPDDIVYIKKYLTVNAGQTHKLAVFIKKLSKIVPLRSLVTITDSLAATSLQLPQILGVGRESNFVLLFLNNYEIRPGGGFIGSVGFITLKDFSITKFEVQDVYEIDGQITTHHEPHIAVRKYLNQPNEFLRDSNFSPDFSVDAQKALEHLSYVPAYDKPYVAVVGITTTAFEDLLRLTGPIALTDFNTTITSSNFFTITQSKIENDFFPGSKQKRSMLQSLGNVMIQRIEGVPIWEVSNYIQKSISTKNLVFFSPNKRLQTFLTALDVSGKQDSFYSDWIMPVDANVGVNKMDALINKTMLLQLSRDDLSLTHTFKSTYTNTITADALVKETYKNYFQLYVPKDAVFKKAFLNGNEVNEEVVTTQENGSLVFALYFETPPASSSTVSIIYDLSYSSQRGKINFRKQIGSKSSPLTVIYQGKNTKIEQELLDSDTVFTLF